MKQIPLSQRLETMDALGFSDPDVLPDAIRAWGSTPAERFFPDDKSWECIVLGLRVSPEQEHTLTYAQMARAIFDMVRSARTDREKGDVQSLLAILAGSVIDVCRYRQKKEAME